MAYRPFAFNWRAALRAALAALLVLGITVYSLSVAPGLIAEGKGEMPRLFGWLLRLLEFVLP